MPKKYRLSDKKIIENCAIKGYRTSSKFFIIKKLDSIDKKFAIVISKKVEKKATARNKIRRQIRTIVLKTINNISNGNYLIVVKHTTILGEIEFKVLEQDLLKVLH